MNRIEADSFGKQESMRAHLIWTDLGNLTHPGQRRGYFGADKLLYIVIRLWLPLGRLARNDANKERFNTLCRP